MKLGLQVNNFTWEGGAAALGRKFRDIGQMAEEAGFDSLWVMDHFFQIPNIGEVQEPMLEAYSALSFIAGATSRIKLGAMVTGVTYRHPGILIKTVTSLDVLSGGRAYLGIGAAWFEREHAGLGVPFPALKERFERLEETLRLAHQMWSAESGGLEAKAFEGRHYRLAQTLNVPQPVSKRHPPILIGGGGEQKTLRLVAQYGDACNLFYRMGAGTLRHKLDVLRKHCEELGRPYEEIEKTALSHFTLTRDGSADSLSPRQVIEQFRDMAELGFDHGIVSMRNVTDPQIFELFHEEIAPAVREL